MSRQFHTLPIVDAHGIHEARTAEPAADGYRWIAEEGPLDTDALIPLVFQTHDGQRTVVVVTPVGLEKLRVQTQRLSAFATTGEWPEEE